MDPKDIASHFPAPIADYIYKFLIFVGLLKMLDQTGKWFFSFLRSRAHKKKKASQEELNAMELLGDNFRENQVLILQIQAEHRKEMSEERKERAEEVQRLTDKIKELEQKK